VLSVVGLGPGDASLLAPLAWRALEESEVIIGYTRYIELLPPELTAGKELVARGMTRELDRAKLAVESCRQGQPTAVVSSGDAGIYGMAGLVLEVLEKTGAAETIPCRIVPGIPALCAAAALLGAPLVHDFATISLSDLLTPWETIEKRLLAAVEADFVVVLYNPRSKRRTDQLEKALAVFRAERSPDTPLGMVRNAYREGQQVRCARLADFDPSGVDMATILILGNSQTRLHGERMITPRGYFRKYDLDQAE
jgi:precorrin-3B C17-methyltransferase